MYVNRSREPLRTGTFGFFSKRLCQLLLLLLYALLLSYAQATTLGQLDNSAKTGVNSEAKKTPKHQAELTATPRLDKLKLKLSRDISNTHLAEARSVSDQKVTSLRPQSRPSNPSANSPSAGNNTSVLQHASNEDVEQALVHENRLLLGLTLIFLSGLVIIYLVSRYKQLF